MYIELGSRKQDESPGNVKEEGRLKRMTLNPKVLRSTVKEHALKSGHV